MELLLISVKSDISHGGIAVWTDRFLSRCAAQGISCSLVNTELIGSRVETGRRNPFDELVRTLRIFRQLKGQLKSGSFRAAHLNTSCGNFGLFRDLLIARYIKARGIPLVTHYHCDIPYWIRNGISRRCLGLLARLSDRNLVLCENSRRFMKDNYSLDCVKLSNFVEADTVLDKPRDIRPRVERVFFVGRVEQAKGVEELYAVARQLPHITFQLVGNVCSQVKGWEKPDNVRLLGTLPNDQVITRLDEADLFILPSHTEGCSMALMEAMARGVPAIATDVGANADMLSEDCGIITPKHDIAAMVAAIRAMEDPVLRQTMSRNAVEKVRREYTDRNVDEILAIIENI